MEVARSGLWAPDVWSPLKSTPFGWSIPPRKYYSSCKMVPFLSHLSHSVLCLNHFANHQHHHGSYQQVLRQNCPMDSHLTSDIRSGLKSSFKNKSNVAGTCRALPCLAQGTDLKNSVRCLSLVQKLILLRGHFA